MSKYSVIAVVEIAFDSSELRPNRFESRRVPYLNAEHLAEKTLKEVKGVTWVKILDDLSAMSGDKTTLEKE